MIKIFSIALDKLFTKYTDLDLDIIKLFNKYNFYLMGGTAIEFYMNSVGLKSWRSRSDNDLDFTSKVSNIKSLPTVIKESEQYNIYPSFKSLMYYKLKGNGIEIDILFDQDNKLNDIKSISKVNLVSPSYIIQTKLDRLYKVGIGDERGKKDLLDIRDMLRYINKTKSKLNISNDPNNYIKVVQSLL